MAISNLLPAGGANDNRPNLKQFFNKNPAVANDNVERVSSGMFTNTFMDSVVTTLHGLVDELRNITDIAKNVIASFGAIVKSLKSLNKEITSRFRVLNSELNASKIDFIKAVLAVPKMGDVPKIDGVPVNINAPETAKDENKGLSFGDLLAGYLGLSIAKSVLLSTLRGLITFATTLGLPLLKTVASFFTGALGGPALIAALTGWGLYKVMGGMIDDYNKKLGIVPGMSEDEIKSRKEAAQGERKEAPYRDMAELRLLAAQIMDGKHDEELGIKPTDNAKESDKIRQKIAGDLLLPTPVIDPRLTNRPVLKTRAERVQGTALAQGEPGFTGTQGQTMQNAATASGYNVGAPAPVNPTKGMTPVERSRYNRDQAAKAMAAPAASTTGGITGSVSYDSAPPPGSPAGSAQPTAAEPPENEPTNKAGTPSLKPSTGSSIPVPGDNPIGGNSTGPGVSVTNTSVENVGRVRGAETNGMTGQNLPMFARNPQLDKIWGKQLLQHHQ